MSLPNVITLARIVAVPLLLYLIISGAYMSAFWLLIAAGISDGVDGFIAKHFNMRTQLGAYLDPLADKILLVSVFVTLGIAHFLPTWLVMLAVSRDLLIVGAFLLAWILDRDVRIAPLMISKVNTAAQILLVGVVLADLAYRLDLDMLRWALIFIVAPCTVSSGAIYLFAWARDMAGGENHTKPLPGKSGVPKTGQVPPPPPAARTDLQGRMGSRPG